MKEHSQIEDQNIVQFPTGKKEREPILADHLGSDPLEDLLNEFEDITNIIDSDNEEAIKTLEKVVSKMVLPEDLLAEEFSAAGEFKAKLNILEEVNQRIKYYLDEVEVFIPKVKK